MKKATCLVAILLSTAATLAFTGCDFQIQKPYRADDQQEPDGEAREATLSPTFSSLHRSIFQPKCGTCHIEKSKGGVSLADYAATMASVGDSGPSVVAGDPEHSHLYLQTKSGEMPRRASHLSDEEVEAIHAWIRGGALEN